MGQKKLSDLDLLELAVRNAGYDDAKYAMLGIGQSHVRGYVHSMRSQKYYDEFGSKVLNPLENNQDALNLAIKHQLEIRFRENDHITSVQVGKSTQWEGLIIQEKYITGGQRAMRRAICRWLAEDIK